METTFRIATIADFNILLEFMREFYELEHLTFDEGTTPAALEQILNDDSLGRVWLIYWGNEEIGYVVLTLGYSLEFRGRDAFVDELYIRDGYRGQGVGTKTLQFVEDACGSLGVQALHLEVERKNTKAQSLYRREGFEDHDRYLMTKWINTESN
jgi:GNAT superfamily N-acetyltransferase